LKTIVRVISNSLDVNHIKFKKKKNALKIKNVCLTIEQYLLGSPLILCFSLIVTENEFEGLQKNYPLRRNLPHY